MDAGKCSAGRLLPASQCHWRQAQWPQQRSVCWVIVTKAPPRCPVGAARPPAGPASPHELSGSVRGRCGHRAFTEWLLQARGSPVV